LRRFDRRCPAIRALATALSVLLVWTPTARLWADAFADTGRAGQAVGPRARWELWVSRA